MDSKGRARMPRKGYCLLVNNRSGWQSYAYRYARVSNGMRDVELTWK